MTFFDTHSHLNFSQYDDDRDEVLVRMNEAGVGTIAVGTDVRTSREVVILAREYENIWAAVGVHPTEAGNVDFSHIKALVTESKVIAVGECGLDFFHKPYDESKQKEIFLLHIQLAEEHSLPLIIHCRNAYGQLLELLGDKGTTQLKGVMHFFAGSVEDAKRFLDLGLFISFAGPITFTDEYDRVITETPLNRILIETDAPFAAPAPYRGKRNEPSFVVEVAKKIATVKGVTPDEVAKQTMQNARELFNI